MLDKDQARITFLGQAGYIIESQGIQVVIDPYLSDSVGRLDPRFTRQVPIPMKPEALCADYFIVTHNHLDHLDPETISAYPHKDNTLFIAPRRAAMALRELGVPRIQVVDHGDEAVFPGLRISGVFALGSDPDVVDTTGYHIAFDNGRSVYHTSDTAFCSLLTQACPKAEVLLCCINGKDGNLTIDEAIRLTRAVGPRYVIPNHYDMMALNAEDPRAFQYFHEAENAPGQCTILSIMETFEWREGL